MRASRAGKVVWQAAVVTVGLAAGLGAVAVTRGGSTSLPPPTPSVSRFSFSTAAPAPGPPPEAAPVLTTEPSGARAALAALLEPLTRGNPELAYPLLDEPSRRRFPTVAAWARAQADRPRPLTFQLGADRPALGHAGDTVDIEVETTHTPSLDPFRGLVPGRSLSVWQVRQEAGAWRVAADPTSFQPLLPADGSAAQVVQAWVARMAGCDRAGAAALQVAGELYGPAGLVRAPCEKRGDWTTGTPVGLDATPDPKSFLAAFGPDVGRWARLVPVQGQGAAFFAAVAPIGDSWLVMGVATQG